MSDYDIGKWKTQQYVRISPRQPLGGGPLTLVFEAGR